MQFVYMLAILIGFGLTGYGYWIVMKDMQIKKKAVWKSLIFLFGLIIMLFGILLYGVPNFFSSH
jgi:hypothetical protein